MKRITINHPSCSYDVWDRVMSLGLMGSKARHEFSESTLTFSDDLTVALPGSHTMRLIFGMKEDCIGNKISLRY